MNVIVPDRTAGGSRARGRKLPPRRCGREDELQRQVDTLIGRMTIAVIYGGSKSDAGAVINQTTNPRSWKSYQAVAEDIAHALERCGCGKVILIPDDMRLGERLRAENVHFAWLNTGGVQGYSSMAHASAMMEMFGLPYVGHDPLTASVLDNKHVFKQTLKANGIPTAPFMTWHLAQGIFQGESNARFRKAFGKYRGPFIVKPVSGRASLGVQVVETVAELTDAVSETYLKTENHVLIEKFLGGREFCIAVCGPVSASKGKLSRRSGPFVFAAIERRLDDDEKIFTSMDLRPITRSRVRALDPGADATEIAQLERLGRSVFHELNLETLVRLDVRADAAGRMYVLEANPKPDLKAPTAEKTSLVCASLQQYEMSYDDLILSLLADRIDLLFACRRGTVNELAALLE